MNGPRRLQRRKAVIDDIPEARRSLPVAPRNSRWRLGALLATGLLLAASLALAGTWRGWFGSAPVPGLAARLSSDGRLLGHFPYRQTPEDTLVSIGSPHRLHRDAAASLLAMIQAGKGAIHTAEMVSWVEGVLALNPDARVVTTPSARRSASERMAVVRRASTIRRAPIGPTPGMRSSCEYDARVTSMG